MQAAFRNLPAPDVKLASKGGALPSFVVLPLYGAFLLVSIALSGMWRAGCVSVRAAQRAAHHLATRHRTNP